MHALNEADQGAPSGNACASQRRARQLGLRKVVDDVARRAHVSSHPCTHRNGKRAFRSRHSVERLLVRELARGDC